MATKTPSPKFLPSRLDLAATTPYRIPAFERAGMLRLDINENPAGAPDFVVEAVVEALRGQQIATYPVYSQWIDEASRYFGLPAEQITCTSGGDEGIKTIFDSHLLAGKALLTVSPGYDMFRLWAGLLGNPVVEVDLRCDTPANFPFDVEAWLAALRPGPDEPVIGLVALANPSNPTGAMVPRAVIEQTLAMLDCPVIIDETYGEFLGVSALDLIAAHRNLFVTRSFSKVYGLAGLRVGVVMSQADNIEGLRRVLNPFNVNRAAIAASQACMRHPEYTRAHVAEVAATRALFGAEMRRLGLATGAEHGNFLVVDFGERHGQVVDGLAAEGILVRDRHGKHPNLDGCVRIAIGTAAQMRRTASAIGRLLRPRPTLDGLIFDVDGTLVDVSASYRAAIERTAGELLRRAGQPAAVVNATLIDEFKARGGLNNDWDCTAAIVASFGVEVDRDDLIARFQRHYLGLAFDGLIAHEPWLLGEDTEARLLERWPVAIVTGRPRGEAAWTLSRHADPRLWQHLVAMENVSEPKPSPEGLLQAQTALGCARLAYIGDSVDDMKAAKAAGMLALGVLPVDAGWESGWAERLQDAGADAVFTGVQEVLQWLNP